ncbi:MAG: BadF/BadG/BcrA/BcrD ATPase family protein, partial [Thermoanaerobaculia bacterium]
MNETKSDWSANGELFTAGLDVGSSAIKTVILRTSEEEGEKVLALRTDRIRKRDLRKVIQEAYSMALEEADLTPESVAYAASTGEGELVDFRRGHFYGMTTHARGAVFLVPEARAVLDVGALHA